MPQALDIQLDGLCRVSGPPTALDLRRAVRGAQLSRLARAGLPASKAAEVVGCSPSTARSAYRDPAFQRRVLGSVEDTYAPVDEAFVEHRQGFHQLLEEQAYKSFDDLVKMLDNPHLQPGLRAKINLSFLDRHPESQEGNVRTHKIDPAALMLAAAVAKEMDLKRVNSIKVQAEEI